MPEKEEKPISHIKLIVRVSKKKHNL